MKRANKNTGEENGNIFGLYEIVERTRKSSFEK